MKPISIAYLSCARANGIWKAAGARLRGVEVEVASVTLPAAASLVERSAICVLDLSDVNISHVVGHLKQGCSVLMGASNTLSEPVLDELEVAATNGGGRLAIVNPDRHSPARRLIREQMAAGKLGVPGLVRVHRWECAKYRGNPADSPSLPTPLLRDLDTVLWLFEMSPNVVYASEPATTDDRPTNRRYVQIHLGFPGGAMALFDYAGALPEGDGYASLSVIGAAGAAYADDHQNMQLVYQSGLPRAARVGEDIQQLASLLQEFADGLREGRDFSDGAVAWRQVLAVQDAALRSVATREAISLETP